MSLTGDVGSVVAGVLNGQRGIPKPNLDELFATIKNAGVQQRDMINQLPAELKPLYDEYIASNKTAATDLTSGTAAITDQLQKQTEANYGPEATRAALDAVKGDIYAELPGQQDAIREALAGSGGFDRGTAGKQLAAPAQQAAAKYASAAANITADQLKTKQAATQQAITTIASMNDQALQQVFGMSKEQATQILTGNRQDLKDQLTQLINQSNNEAQQTLGVQGDVAMNNYQQQVADTARKDALTNGIVKLGSDGVQDAISAGINAPTGGVQGGVGGTTSMNPQFGQVWSPVA